MLAQAPHPSGPTVPENFGVPRAIYILIGKSGTVTQLSGL